MWLWGYGQGIMVSELYNAATQFHNSSWVAFADGVLDGYINSPDAVAYKVARPANQRPRAPCRRLASASWSRVARALRPTCALCPSQVLHNESMPWDAAVGDHIGLFPIAYVARDDYRGSPNATDGAISHRVAEEVQRCWVAALNSRPSSPALHCHRAIDPPICRAGLRAPVCRQVALSPQRQRQLL